MTLSPRGGGVFNLYVKNADGTTADELLLKTPHNKVINDWSADGRYILSSEDDPATKADLWVLPVAGDGKPSQVFVQRFPAAGGKWQVSTNGGTHPRWRPDGKELFLDNSGTMLAVDLTGTVPGGAFKAGVPQRLFQALSNFPPHNYDVAADGRRFLVVSARAAQDGPAPIVVVLNWMTGLKP